MNVQLGDLPVMSNSHGELAMHYNSVVFFYVQFSGTRQTTAELR